MALPSPNDEKFRRWWFSATIRSTRGFSVESLPRAGLWYRERECKMFVESEFAAMEKGIIVMPFSIQGWEASV